MENRLEIERRTRVLFEHVGNYGTIRDALIAGSFKYSIRDEIIELNMPLAVYFADKFWRRGKGVCGRDDLRSAAYMGLTEAVDSFEPSRRKRFPEWAQHRIRKRLVMEWEATHWTSVKPPKKLRADFYAGRLSDEEYEDYKNKYMGVGWEEDSSD